jgi:hypothetical protein
MKLKNSLKVVIGVALSIGYIGEANANFTGKHYVDRKCHKSNYSNGGSQTFCSNYHRLNITSEFDEPIKITDVKVNRGNCRIMFLGPSVLKWGQSETWTLMDSGCNIREVTIHTDRGSQTLKWN